MPKSVVGLDRRHYNNEELRALREGRGKNIGQVAEELGVEYRRVMRAELGTAVTYEFLCRLARYYDRPVTYFLYQYPATA